MLWFVLRNAVCGSRVILDIAFYGVFTFDFLGRNARRETALRLADAKVALKIVGKPALALAMCGAAHFQDSLSF
jgi:hypothetical protein